MSGPSKLWRRPQNNFPTPSGGHRAGGGEKKRGARRSERRGGTKMKNKTKIEDLKKTITLNKAQKKLEAAKARLDSAIASRAGEGEALQEVITRRAEAEAAKAAFGRLPLARRQAAVKMEEDALELGRRAVSLGGSYSGDVKCSVTWGDSANASTVTARGDQYSRKCFWRKVNARHTVQLDPAGIPMLVSNPALCEASRREGLPLIALYPDGGAVWVKRVGKRIEAQKGWVAMEDGLLYHSTVSYDHAKAAVARKAAILRREKALRLAEQKLNRRAALVARLCGGVTATVADAEALGYCTPGIRSFQQRFQIGDSAPLPVLVKTGDPSAVRLALHVARRVARQHEEHLAVAA